MLQIEAAEKNDDAKTDFYENVKELYSALLVSKHQTQNWEPDAATTNVHIVFGDSIAGSLKNAIKQLGKMDTNKVISLTDRFSIGPLWRFHEEAGRLQRGEWFRDNINLGYDEEDDDDAFYHQSLIQQLAAIPEQASIVIWSGSNAHEQVGLRCAVYLLGNMKNSIFVFDAGAACNRRFDHTDRSYTYLHSGEISIEKLMVIFRDREEGRAIDSETRQVLKNEWLALAGRHEVLRIWNGESIQGVDEDYFDSYLLEIVENMHHEGKNHDFIKSARVIGEAIGSGKQYLNDCYYEYRLRNLIYHGELEIKGVPRAMRYYSVRRKGVGHTGNKG